MNTPTTGSHPSASRPIRLFQIWENADQRVPFPSLYSLLVQPGSGEPALELDRLARCSFCYRVTDGFVATLEFSSGVFGPATLQRQTYSYKLVPISGRFGLLPPDEAEQLLERYLEGKAPVFWNEFLAEAAPGIAIDPGATGDVFVRHFRQLSWQSLRLAQPFGAGIGEPFYQFRKRDSRIEFWVGARTGDIHDELVRPDAVISAP
jgi:hypothetical protein